MITEMNIKVVCEEQFSNREIKILETFLSTLSGHSNAFVTKEGMFLNPLSKEKSVVYYHNFVFVKSLTEEKCAELKEVLTRRIKNAFVMMEFVEPIVTFEEIIINV
ncbi:hypothetical protein [Bacillus toyonensis]|uniref:hypothetical protein n=1 Tax=Bacillus toyonensis TaxID=155322 RepID=UPI000BEE78BF|nr:hypothetical protein [Bacillus toyonensis]PEB22403.1 hypothetical protein COO05_22425 [Bacillus toyonensis]PEE83282.1 hypothetical protein COO15_08155 [Bacillus toyonensis]PFX66602.1 hypothetical protein COL35_16355 [Bacillus toyonensis]PFY80279.1 hypothetical protein COL59_27885 [Bacillus toyonensis]PHG44783.1 hypothetical protein COI57_23105 [Bacillus toyonensis]